MYSTTQHKSRTIHYDILKPKWERVNGVTASHHSFGNISRETVEHANELFSTFKHESSTIYYDCFQTEYEGGQVDLKLNKEIPNVAF